MNRANRSFFLIRATVLLLLSAILLSACTPISTPDSPLPDTPSDSPEQPNDGLVSPDQPDQPDVPEIPDTPEMPDVPEIPDEPEQPVLPPINSFSPNSPMAGTPFFTETDIPTADTSHAISQFYLSTDNNPQLPFSVACYVTDTAITAMLPAGIDCAALIPSFTLAADAQLFVGGKELISDVTPWDAEKNDILAIRTPDGEVTTLRLIVEALQTGLPSVAITTDEFTEITSKEEYLTGQFYVGGGSAAICPYAADSAMYSSARIKGRGNSSWLYEKKSYTVKLDAKLDVLGMGRSRNWALVSNYQDKSLMRNEIASQLSSMLGIPTMETRSVDLWLNGKYHGTYMVIEKIELEEGRLEIPEFDPTLPPESLGYLLEWDGHVSEVKQQQKNQWIVKDVWTYDPVSDVNFLTILGRYLVIQKPSPSKINEAQVRYVQNRIQKTNDAILSLDLSAIERCVDLHSFAAWYLVEDIMKNMDSRFWSSCYMHIDADGLLYMGPVWDFDLSLGNANYGGVDVPTGEYISSINWYKNLLMIPEFCEYVLSLLDACRKELDQLPAYINDYAVMLERSQAYNFERWNILDKKVGSNPEVIVQANTHALQVEYLISFYRARLAYVRQEVENCYTTSLHISEEKQQISEVIPTGGLVLWSGLSSSTSDRSLKITQALAEKTDISDYASDGVLCLTYYMDNTSLIHKDCQMELTSSGTSDKNELNWNLRHYTLQSGGWYQLYLPMSQAGFSGGSVDLTCINYFRFYIHVSGNATIKLADVRIFHADEIKK